MTPLDNLLFKSLAKPNRFIESFGLIRMQLPEKYKENFDISNVGPSSGRTFAQKRRRSPGILQV